MNKSVLIVEDEPVTLRAMNIVLKKYFDHIDTAADGTEGFEKYSANKYDLILLDLALPGLHGTELLKIIKKQTPDLPVIICTAYDSEADRTENVPVMIKPISIESLMAVVEDIMGIEIVD